MKLNWIIEKKKLAASILAGTVVASTLSFSALAYKDEWTAKIQQGIQYLAVNVIFKNDIQKTVKEYGDATENNFKTWAGTLIESVTNDLNTFKTSEINRGKAEIDGKVQNDKTRLKEATDNAIQAQKNNQASKTDAQIQVEKADLDKIVDDSLSNVPSQ